MKSEFKKKSLTFNVSETIGDVSALLYTPDGAEQVLVFAHGAGAPMLSKSMEQFAVSLAKEKIATLRFNFPYMENGKKVPDKKPVACAAIQAAVNKGIKLFPKLPVFAGGKSFGGRMTSTAASEDMIPEVKGIVFFGFPLHAPGRASNDRAEHLYKVNVPMLFLQGTRDALASLEFLKPVITKLGKKAQLFIIEGADHSFHISKDYKMKDPEAVEVMCSEVKKFMTKILKN